MGRDGIELHFAHTSPADFLLLPGSASDELRERTAPKLRRRKNACIRLAAVLVPSLLPSLPLLGLLERLVAVLAGSGVTAGVAILPSLPLLGPLALAGSGGTAVLPSLLQSLPLLGLLELAGGGKVSIATDEQTPSPRPPPAHSSGQPKQQQQQRRGACPSVDKECEGPGHGCMHGKLAPACCFDCPTRGSCCCCGGGGVCAYACWWWCA